MNDERVIDIDPSKTKDDVLKRRYEVVKEIVVNSAATQLQEVRTFQIAASVGLWQGLKYRGNLGQGIKAGVATVVVITGCNVISNIITHFDDIKNA